MRSWRPFCCGLPGLMRSIAIPSLSHQTESLDRLKSALGLAKGTPLSVRMAFGRPNSLKTFSKTGVGFLGALQGFAGNQVTAGEVGDRQRIAVAAIGQHELALVVGAPQIIGLIARRQRCAGGFVTPAPPALDQPMAIQNRMHRADRRRMNVRIETDQPLPDLRCTPARLVLLEAHDLRLDLKRQLIGVAVRSARAIG